MSIIAQRVDANGLFMRTTQGSYTLTTAEAKALIKSLGKDAAIAKVVTDLSAATGTPVEWIVAEIDQATGGVTNLSVTVP